MPYGPGMSSSTSTAEPASSTLSTRQAQRLETRGRLFDAALAEIGRSGLAGADVSAIAAAAGVARGTFYFHFPTKEHVMVELERDEEAKIVANSKPERLLSDLASLLADAGPPCARRRAPVGAAGVSGHVGVALLVDTAGRRPTG